MTIDSNIPIITQYETLTRQFNINQWSTGYVPTIKETGKNWVHYGKYGQPSILIQKQQLSTLVDKTGTSLDLQMFI